ncbi:MAG TPA: rhomboid family intramembrane serine protease [Methylomirabilota bacterium]|jgi:rhomboid family protein|nr:rhomboid family intramembrane serine protease [Methylomirabilota bacterium]
MIPIGDSVPNSSWPVVTWGLIGLNVWVFLYEVTLGPDLEAFIQTWAFIPAQYFLLADTAPGEWAARYVPIFSSMFLHGGWAHLIGNMVYLWIFGDNVEDRLGHFRYLAFYLLSGVAAALVQAHLHPDSAIPTVGASGAISGILGAYLVLFPTARVYTLVPLLLFFPVLEFPAVLYLGIWFLMQLVSGTASLTLAADAGGVAWWAHVGGFVVGVVLAPILRRRESYPKVWRDQYAPW